MKQALTTTVHLLNILIMLFIFKVVLGFGISVLTLYFQMTRISPSSSLI